MLTATTEIYAQLPPAKGTYSDRIRYAVGQCSLGALLVAATEFGLCAILLGDDEEQVKHDLSSRFSKAELSEATVELREQLQIVAQGIDLPIQSSAQNLRLDPQGTAFQRKVWGELQQIPSGQTISYGQLAERIGNPRAARAVAAACASNPLAVVIPCHRVVGGNGKLTGYRWGLKRKQNLLQMEQHNG